MSENVNQEMWKSVIGFDGLYEVSTFGRIRRMAGSTWGKYKLKSSRLLTVHPSSNGYFTVSLYDSGHEKNTHCIHQIVARTFMGNSECSSCGTSLEVNHKDRDKRNNRLDNLEYVTHKENMRKYHNEKLSPKVATSLTNSS